LPTSTTRSGLLLMAGSAALFSLMSTAVRLAAGVPSHTLAFYRFAFGALVVLTLAAGGVTRLRTGNLRFLLWRGGLGGVAVYLFYLAICKVGLAKGTLLANSYPIFVPVFGALVLKERLPLRVALAVAVALFGIYLLFQPIDFPTVTRYDVLALLGGITAAAAVVCIKKLRETDSPYIIFLSQSVFGVALVALPVAHTGFAVPARLIPVVLAVCVLSVAAQLLMTYSYRLVPAASGSLMGSLTPVFNVLIGVVAFGEKLGHTGVLGCVLVLAVSLYITVTDGQPPGTRS